MADFLSAAFPWIALGIGVAVAVTYMNPEKKKQEIEKKK